MILPTITLREQSAIRPLATGICPAEHKACSTQQPIQRLSLPDRLIIPLQQHAGPAGQLRVVVGQSVAKGEPLTQGIDPYAVPVHASAAGWISAIRPYHPPLQSQKLQLPPPLCVELTVNHQPLKQPSHGFYTPWINYCQRPLEHLRQRAHAAGLAGLGGAGFPSSAKWPKLPVQLLIINAVECEPYITADDSLLREQATAVIQGCHILQHILQAQQTVLAIEENKPQAFAALQQAFTNSVLAGNWLQFRQLPTRYPSGDARQLITLLTGHSVPLGQHSSQLGVVVHNVATLFALQQAPWWLAVLGTLFAIIVAKQLYGGLGHNLFNPAMLGYVVLLVSFPGPMGNWPAPSLAQQTRPGFLATGAIIGQLSTPQSLLSDSVTQATPLDRLTSQQHQPSPAATSPTATIEPAWLALNLSYLLGGLLLLYLGIIQWQIPVSLLTLLLLCSTLGYWFSPLFSASPMFHLASGATLCGAFFIATDPVTAAATVRGRLLFGTLIGLLLWLIRRFGDYPDGMAFAVLLANSCVPWLDQFSQPAVYGDRSSH